MDDEESDMMSNTTTHECPVCNYRLVDISPNCPECGSPIRLAVVSQSAFAGYGLAVALSLALATLGLVETYEEVGSLYNTGVTFVDSFNAMGGPQLSRWAMLREVVPVWNWMTIALQLVVAVWSSVIAWMLILRRRQPFKEARIRRIKTSLYGLAALQIALWLFVSLAYLVL